MTILTGEEYVIESWDQFMNRLDVSQKEILLSADKEGRADIVESHNEYCHEWDGNEVGSVKDFSENNIHDFHELVARSLLCAILDVLEQREQNYIHLYDGTVHTIVELHPDQDALSNGGK